MSISHDERTELHDLVEGVLGSRGADLLMAGLAAADLEGVEERLSLRIDNARLEVRADLADLRTELRGELGDLRGELKGEIGDLRGELGGLRGELKGEIGELRGELGDLRTELKGEIGELRGELGDLRTELKGEIGELRIELASQTRSVFLAVFSAVGAVAGLVLAALAIVT